MTQTVIADAVDDDGSWLKEMMLVMGFVVFARFPLASPKPWHVLPRYREGRSKKPLHTWRPPNSPTAPIIISSSESQKSSERLYILESLNLKFQKILSRFVIVVSISND